MGGKVPIHPEKKSEKVDWKERARRGRDATIEVNVRRIAHNAPLNLHVNLLMAGATQQKGITYRLEI